MREVCGRHSGISFLGSGIMWEERPRAECRPQLRDAGRTSSSRVSTTTPGSCGKNVLEQSVDHNMWGERPRAECRPQHVGRTSSSRVSTTTCGKNEDIREYYEFPQMPSDIVHVQFIFMSIARGGGKGTRRKFKTKFDQQCNTSSSDHLTIT